MCLIEALRCASASVKEGCCPALPGCTNIPQCFVWFHYPLAKGGWLGGGGRLTPVWDSQHNDASAAGILHVGMGSSTCLATATAELEPAEELSDKLRRGLSRKSSLSNGSTLILGSKKMQTICFGMIISLSRGTKSLELGSSSCPLLCALIAPRCSTWRAP